MRKILIALAIIALIVVSIPVGLIATGTIDGTSVRMILNVMTGLSGPPADSQTVRQRYRVPEGFSVSLYATDLPRARFLHVTDAGDLLVSRSHAGDIVLLRRDADGDGLPDGRTTLLEGLQRPLGLDIAGQWLYVGESNRIGRVAFDQQSGQLAGEYEIILDGLTDNGNHWSKTVRVGPDDKLYLAQGSTCNVCTEEDERRATMMRMELDGSDPQIIATGLRNSVGFDWAPWDGSLYATDNGRDLLGDDFPPCELNRIERGNFYGWPYFNGDNVPDPDMGPDPASQSRTPVPPVHGFRAHNAPLGITFLDGGTLPAQYRRSALVALHGSWNRSSPDGYKVVSLHFDGDTVVERDFLSGFLQDGDISGRPVDVAQGPDGSIYVSDDYAGAVYRVTYGQPVANAAPASALPVRNRLDDAPPAWLETADLPALAQRGERLYGELNCASCHEQGENPRRLEGLADRLGYTAVIDTLRAPPSPMPVFTLGEQDQRALAVFLLTRDEAR
jgi:glucose/arabinose dehydrogenase